MTATSMLRDQRDLVGVILLLIPDGRHTLLDDIGQDESCQVLLT